MGACATKPKADATDAPAPEPLPELHQKELATTGTVIETKEVVVDADKSRSLSNLFKEGEEGKGIAESDKTQSELVNEEECLVPKTTDISKTETIEVVKSEVLVDKASIPAEVKAGKQTEVETATEENEISVEKTEIPTVDVPVKVEVEESIEVEPAAEKTETSEEKASEPVVCSPVELEADKGIEIEKPGEIQNIEPVEEKKIEEYDVALTQKPESIEVEPATLKTDTEEKTSIPVVFAPAEVEADKEIKVVPATETEKTEEVDEKKIEEPEKAVESQKSEAPEVFAEESKEATQLEKPALLPDEKIVEGKSLETKVEDEKEVTETQKSLEERTTESEVSADNVKP